MLLADFGAEVVKLRPDGRAVTPHSVVFDRGKSIVTDRTMLRDLVAWADVLVTADGAGWPGHPQLVHLHTPPYLEPVPWSGGVESEGLLAAITGVALRQASFDGGPIDSIYPHLLTVQGVWAAACAVAALYERESSGLGQHVTVSGLHGMMIAGAGALTFDASVDEPVVRERPGGPGGGVPFYRTYQCGDGQWLFLAALTPRFTELAFKVLGLTGLLDDERLEGGGRAAILRPDHSRWAIDRIGQVFRTRPRADWLAALAAEGCPAGPLEPREGWLDHPQLEAIGMRVELDDPDLGPVIMPGIPSVLTKSPGRIRSPRPGGSSQRFSSPASSNAGDRRRNGPLDGIKVLDLGAIIAGPFGASLLAELGADVVKVEPLTGDSFRGPGFAAYNKGQRGIALDLAKPEGRRAFSALAAQADVVLDNYRPGVLGRLGLDYESLTGDNPAIVTASITGFGEGGPLGNEPGFDPVLQALSGMMLAQGGDSDPVFFTVPVNDVAAAATTAFGVCAALFHRRRTGEGQRTWTSLAAMSALLQAGHLVRYTGRPAPPVGGRDFRGPSADDGFVPTADGGWIRVAGPARVRARSARELAADPAILEAEVLHPDPRPGRAGWVTPGRHARFSRTERTGTLVAPSLGEHTREVLAEAGFSDEEIDDLLTSGVASQRAD